MDLEKTHCVKYPTFNHYLRVELLSVRMAAHPSHSAFRPRLIKNGQHFILLQNNLNG